MDSILAQIPTPDTLFWYTLATLMAGALIWVIATYINRTGVILDQLTDTVQRLDKMITMHEHLHKEHDRRFTKLESKKK